METNDVQCMQIFLFCFTCTVCIGPSKNPSAGNSLLSILLLLILLDTWGQTHLWCAVFFIAWPIWAFFFYSLHAVENCAADCEATQHLMKNRKMYEIRLKMITMNLFAPWFFYTFRRKNRAFALICDSPKY